MVVAVVVEMMEVAASSKEENIVPVAEEVVIVVNDRHCGVNPLRSIFEINHERRIYPGWVFCNWYIFLPCSCVNIVSLIMWISSWYCSANDGVQIFGLVSADRAFQSGCSVISDGHDSIGF